MENFKKLNKMEAIDLTRSKKRANRNPFLDFIENLKVGEGTVLTNEMKWFKSHPSNYLYNNYNHTSLRFRAQQAKDGNGWVVRRVA
jgi:hypothetical protein